MSVVSRMGPALLALAMSVASVPGHAQEADDLRVDASDDADIYGDALPPPPPPPVIAQQEDVAAPPIRRRREPESDPFAAQGIGDGPIRFYPSLEIGSLVTSNAGARASDASADVALRLKPTLRAESNWSRHQFTASASGEIERYLENGDLSTKNADIEAGLRLDLRRSTRLELDAAYALASENASDSEVPDTAEGVRLSHTLSGGAALVHEAGFGETQLSAGVTRQAYSDVALSGGGLEDNADRNYTELGLSLRGVFNPGGRVQPFVEAAWTPRLHDRARDRNGLKRNSQGYAVTAGLRFDDSPILSGDVAATYQIRDYADDALGTETAPGVLADLVWRPTELTSLTLTSGVTLAETVDADNAARASWTAGLGLTHALRENLSLFGGLGITFDEAQDGHDRTLDVTSGIEWMMNSNLAWRLAYEGTWFDGVTSADYNEQRLLASIVLKR